MPTKAKMDSQDERDDDIVSLDEEEDDEDVPDVATCQRLVEEFASVTGTDEALAQFYLQDRKWDLERSVNAYFETKNGGGGIRVIKDGEEPELLVTFDSKMVSLLESSSGRVSTDAPESFKLITWNLDGLDSKHLKKRTKAVANIIESEKPDIVFLQELVPITFSYLENALPQYVFVAGGTDNYFCATALLRTTVYFDGHTILNFKGTRMGRNLLCVEAHIGDIKLNLLNTHLESTAEFAEERMEQLKVAFKYLTAKKMSRTTSILAGDLNIRDKEVIQVGIPSGVFDLWEACGRRPEVRYTWDTMRNTNKEIGGRYKPRMRFDRVYMCQPSDPIVTPKHFGLVGIQKVAGLQSFPSDHWGIVTYYEAIKGKTNRGSTSSQSTATESSHNTDGNLRKGSSSGGNLRTATANQSTDKTASSLQVAKEVREAWAKRYATNKKPEASSKPTSKSQENVEDVDCSIEEVTILPSNNEDDEPTNKKNRYSLVELE